MSMISSQCNKLRDTAMRVEIFLEGSTDAIPMDTHKQLRDAANTIWYLRCKLIDMVVQRDEIERLKAENAKLRELAVGMYGMFEMFDKMLGNHDACETPRPLIFGEDKSFKDVMCELGIEVNDDD